jgi:hypothetical protein
MFIANGPTEGSRTPSECNVCIYIGLIRRSILSSQFINTALHFAEPSRKAFRTTLDWSLIFSN